jgi:hypothetical protein
VVEPGAAPAPTTAEQPQPQPQPQTGPATWPAWFPKADLVLAGLVLLLGFLAASFAARNTDLWVHLAAGKRLVSGGYVPGSDPFSYSAANRPWVNHSWLWDFGAYVLYGGRGVLLVFVKALFVAAAGALLIGMCRPGYPVWPWAALTGVAFLAAAPRLILGPNVASVFLLAATLFILFRVPQRPGSWRIPIAIGVTFWVWANVDAWFILGPLALGLLLLGELAQKKYLEVTEQPDANPDDGPLGRLPDVKTLTRALAVGVVACMLNPHHVRVWELPFELAGSDAIKNDPTMNRVLNMAPSDRDFYEQELFGYNLNGLAYAVLLVGGGAVLGFARGRLRLSHVALWLGFAIVSLLTVFAVPFFAVVAVPLVAAQLNGASARVTLGDRAERRTRLLLIGSGGGRVLCLLAVVVGCLAARPGWLHPPGIDVAGRRVAWAVEPDPELARAAAEIQGWRKSGAVPADAHGFIASVALSDYCAWYAPDEKVFLNSRFNHHRPELPDFVAVRGAVGVIDLPEKPANRQEAGKLLEKHQAVYVAMYNSRGRIGTRQAMRSGADGRTVWQVLGWDEWPTWYTDGRTLVLGWRPGAGARRVALDRVGIDPVVRAFGPGVEPLPPGRVHPAPSARSWTNDFLHPSLPTSAYPDEALGWLEYKQALKYHQSEIFLGSVFLQRNVPRVWTPGMPLMGDVLSLGMQADLLSSNPPPVPAPDPQDGSYQAIPILAVRAARRAIAANPDHPDGYYALARAVEDPDLPLTPGERVVWQITALRQCLDRMPPPDRYRVGTYASSPTDVAEWLTRLYLGITPNGQYAGIPLNLRPLPDALFILVRAPAGDPQAAPLPGPFVPIDVALKTLERAREYAKVEVRNFPDPEMQKAVLERLNNFHKKVDQEVRARFGAYDQARERVTSPAGQYRLALQYSLIGEALRILRETPDLAKEFRGDTTRAALQRVALQLCTGQLEEATADLAEIRDIIDKSSSTDPMLPFYRGAERLLEYHQAVLVGYYPAAGASLEALEGPLVLRRPAFPTLADVHGSILPLSPVAGPDTPVGIALWGQPGGQPQLINYGATRGAILAQMDREASYFFLRGFLALLDGEIYVARSQFAQCFRFPPPGWGLGTAVNTTAIGYLQLIELAEKRAAANTQARP